jgi:hypothetical protein
MDVTRGSRTMSDLPPDKDTWRRLIGPALRVIDSLRHNGYGELDFRLGGGTVLMFRFDHRISKDIDIFTYDAQALSFITPRLNELAGALSSDYEEHANTIKLLLPDGDIDFIVASPVMPDAQAEMIDVDGRLVVTEATAEILAKKLLYRADSFKPRDVFDMAVALALDPAAARQALRATQRTRSALLRRLAAMQTVPAEDLLAGIILTDSGRAHVDGMLESLQQAIANID